MGLFIELGTASARLSAASCVPAIGNTSRLIRPGRTIRCAYTSIAFVPPVCPKYFDCNRLWITLLLGT